MKPIHGALVIICILVAVLLIAFLLLDRPPSEGHVIDKPSQTAPAWDQSMIKPQPATSFKIASWNLQVFGESKASRPNLMARYASEIGEYDIIFVQEIRDSSGTAFPKLCSLLPGYDCKISSRAGQRS
jgi:hypothetical protein